MPVQVDPYINRDPPNLGIETELVICITGDASVGTDAAAWYAQRNFTISRVSVYSPTAPVGASLIVDCHLNGTTIFTTQANRPQVAAGENSDDSDTPDVTSISRGDRVTLDIDQVGSTTAGGNPLMITIVLTKRA